jgi:flavorubredoxin
MNVIKENGSFSFNNIIYSKIIYDNHYAFHFKEDQDQTKEEKDLYINFLTETFKNKFKDMEVVREGDKILFSGEKTILAVFDSTVGSWKMLEYLEDNEIYYSMFLPKEVAEYLGKS